jgi:Tat protein translocase TatB subunit
MFGLGFTEIITILVIVLLVLGPDKLPEFTRTLGKTIWKIRHAADELKDELRLDRLDSFDVMSEEDTSDPEPTPKESDER